ncbi:hypothetical protein ABKA17_47635, partial [Streptomyces sp. RG80]
MPTASKISRAVLVAAAVGIVRILQAERYHRRTYLRRRGIHCTIRDKAGRPRHRKQRGSRGGRPPKFDPVDYRERHAVECGITDFGVLGSVRSVESEARLGEESVEDAVPVLQRLEPPAEQS